MKGKKRASSGFDLYLQDLQEGQREALLHFFADMNQRCALARDEKESLRADFERAILYYHAQGLPLEAALDRLDPRNLGGFYARPPILWYTLDDAAKIYPLSMKQGQMAVFRLSAYMKQPVVPEILQMALTFVIKRFPSFATTVKKGYFWHYLDTAKRRYAVEAETGVPCRPLPIARSGSQTFRVVHHENRISVEFFHILTDGTGGMIFLKSLVAEYLRIMGVSYTGDEILNANALPTSDEVANEFSRADKTEKSGGFLNKPATQMSGRLSATRPCRILHFKMDASQLKAAAKEKNVTITAYILSKMFLAGRRATDEMEGTFHIQVPVNMRKFYPSRTVRNFAMYCGIRLPLAGIADTPELLSEISAQLEEKSSKEAMSEMMNSTQFMVGNLRYIPLFLKTAASKWVYGFLGDQVFSSMLSNLGVITLPQELTAHVESFDFVLDAAVTNRTRCALVTYGGISTLSITKMTAEPTFEEAMYALLSSDGVVPIVEGSPIYDD